MWIEKLFSMMENSTVFHTDMTFGQNVKLMNLERFSWQISLDGLSLTLPSLINFSKTFQNFNILFTY